MGATGHPHSLAAIRVRADLAALDPTETRGLVVDAWRLVGRQKVARAYDLTHPHGLG